MSKRYFIIFFSANSKEDDQVLGNMPGTTNGEYVNQKMMVNGIEGYYKVTNAIITNVLELNEEDYNIFIEE